MGSAEGPDAGVLESLGIVLATLVASLVAVLSCLGLLQLGGAPPPLWRAGVLFVSVSLAIGQAPAAAAISRRIRGRSYESRTMSVGVLFSSLVLLGLAVALSGAGWTG